MRIVKPSWVCSKEPLFSCDVHPDGTKFAAAGQGEGNGKIGIWNLSPVAHLKAEKSNLKRSIVTLEQHQGCVNCVRWSSNGQFLASASDDKVVMIWSMVRYEGSTSESYKCKHVLRGHDGDVLDLAWSGNDNYLASTSIDNTVIVWNCLNFPEKLTTIKGHNGMVKGVVWDPIGRYMATQSTDRTLRVWRLSDWQEEAKITAPFVKCGGTTTVLRIGWSPDGQYIVSSHAMNNEGPVAKIIEREDWKARMDFVGHRRAIESVRFNPQLFYYNKTPVSCVAIAGRDSSISVWLTALKRPLFVLHDVFTSSVLDMSWTPDGYGLIVCSLDGSLAYIELNSSEIGKTLSSQQAASLKNHLYGSLAQDKLTIIENPDLLADDEGIDKNEESTMSESEEAMDTSDEMSTEVSSKSRESSTKPKSLNLNGFSTSNSSSPFGGTNGHGNPFNGTTSIPDKLTQRFDRPSAAPSQLNVAKKQVETTTKDGRRRIMPITLKEIPVAPPTMIKLGSATSKTLAPAIPQPTTDPINLRDTPIRLTNLTKPLGTSNNKLQQNLPQDKLFAIIGPCKIEVNNTNNLVTFITGTKKWTSVISSTATTISSEDRYVVIGCKDGGVYVYDKLGVLALPVLNVGCSIVKSAVKGDYVSVVTQYPAVFIWDVKNKKCVLKNESLASFLNENCYLCTLDITKDGNVTVGLSNRTSYCYSYSLAAWMLLSAHQMDGSWYKELENNNKTPDDVLALIHSSARSSSNKNTSIVSHEKLHLNTVLMLEQQILVSENLNSLPECRLWLSSLIRYVTQQQDENRLQILLQRLISDPSDKIFGDDKIEVLKSLLKIVATNVNCQRVYSDFKQQVEWTESRR